MFLGFMLLVAAGIVWRCSSSVNNEFQRKMVIEQQAQQLAYTQTLQRMQSDLVSLETRIEQSRELERGIVRDAMTRERRAKAALVATLKHSGMSEDFIDKVLRAVDGGEEGDLV